MAGLAWLCVKSNSAYCPNAVSGGHVLFKGLHDVKVWAYVLVVKARQAARAMFVNRNMVEEVVD